MRPAFRPPTVGQELIRCLLSLLIENQGELQSEGEPIRVMLREKKVPELPARMPESLCRRVASSPRTDDEDTLGVCKRFGSTPFWFARQQLVREISPTHERPEEDAHPNVPERSYHTVGVFD